MYISYVRPILEYGNIMFSNMTEEQSLLIENVSKRAGKIISGATAGTSTTIIYDELGWASMKKTKDNFHLPQSYPWSITTVFALSIASP